MWFWCWPYRSGCCRCWPACRGRFSSADCCPACGRAPSRREVEPVRILVLNFEYPPGGGGGGRVGVPPDRHPLRPDGAPRGCPRRRPGEDLELVPLGRPAHTADLAQGGGRRGGPRGDA